MSAFEPMRQVRILPYRVETAANQLQRTEALWREVANGTAPATLRWYGYQAASLILGVGQQSGVVNGDACHRAGVTVVQRSSGGAAVLVDESALALDIALPSSHPLADGDVVEAYHWLGRALAGGLRRFAPAAAAQIVVVTPAQARADKEASRRAPEHSAESPRALVCFGSLSPYEVALVPTGQRTPEGGPVRKLVGLSQLRKRGVVLYQAGLYVRFAASQLVTLLYLPAALHAASKLACDLDRRVADIGDVGGGRDDVPRLISLINEYAVAAITASATDEMSWGQEARGKRQGRRWEDDRLLSTDHRPPTTNH